MKSTGMNLSAEKAKGRLHFNAADVVIAAVLTLCLFFSVLSFISEKRADAEIELIVTLDEQDASQMALCGIYVPAGSTVYDAETGGVLGRLKTDFKTGDSGLCILYKGGRENGNADLIAGLTLGVRCGRLICKTCVLTDIREVN